MHCLALFCSFIHLSRLVQSPGAAHQGTTRLDIDYDREQGAPAVGCPRGPLHRVVAQQTPTPGVQGRDSLRQHQWKSLLSPGLRKP